MNKTSKSQINASLKWNNKNKHKYKKFQMTIFEKDFDLFDLFAGVEGKTALEKQKNLLECYYNNIRIIKLN